MSYAIPEELTFNMLSRMYPSVKTEYRRQPFNQQSFTSGSMIQVMLNKMDRTFANPNTFALNFRAKITVTASGSIATSANSKIYLRGSAWSFFSRYVSKEWGGIDIDQIEWPGRLVNTVMNITTSSDEKSSMISMGFNETNAYTNLGLEIPLGADLGAGVSRTYERTFTIPLIGALNSTKFVPMNVKDIELNFTVANGGNNAENEFAVFVGNIASVNVEILNVELVSELITLEEQGFNQLLQMYPGVFNIKSQSFSYAAASTSLTSSMQAGTVDNIVPFSLNSLKQLIWWASPSNAVCGNHAGVNPNLNNWQLFIGSTAYPQQPVKCISVAECYYQNSKSYGSFYSTGHSGSAVRTNFAKSSTTRGEYTAYTDNGSLTVNNIETTETHPKFYQVLDLEVINQLKSSLYSGISTRGQTNILRLNIGDTLATTAHVLHMYACYDCVLNFDYINGKITYSN